MMSGLHGLDLLFVITSFLFQIILIIHFALRKWRFETAMRYGPIVYALSIPAAVVCVCRFVCHRNRFECHVA